MGKLRHVVLYMWLQTVTWYRHSEIKTLIILNIVFFPFVLTHTYKKISLSY